MSTFTPSGNAFGNYLQDKGYDVSNPIAQFMLVKDDGSGTLTVEQVSANDDSPIGVAQFHVTASEMQRGKGASVRKLGISQVYCTGAATNGDQAGSTGDGTVRVANSGDVIVGMFVSNAIDGGRAAVELSLTGAVAP